MSMNLNLRVDGEVFNLYQTPTWVTYILITDDNGNQNWEVTGDKAKGVLFRYITWVNKEFVGNRYFLSQKEKEESEDRRQTVKEHINKLMKVKDKNLEFWVM